MQARGGMKGPLGAAWARAPKGVLRRHSAPRVVGTLRERTWPMPRRWRAATQTMGGMKGAPGLAGRGPSAKEGPLVD